MLKAYQCSITKTARNLKKKKKKKNNDNNKQKSEAF